VAPASLVRHTAMRASGMKRPWSSPLSGTVNTVSESAGCATMANPKVDGSPASRQSQVRPASSLRYVPQWFCW
jgi:hypothetical protein